MMNACDAPKVAAFRIYLELGLRVPSIGEIMDLIGQDETDAILDEITAIIKDVLAEV